MLGTLPGFRDRSGQVGSGTKTAPAGAVRANEVRVAELADSSMPIGLATSPEVAAGEPAEHCRTTGVASLALQRIEDLFDPIHALRPPAPRPDRSGRGRQS